MTKTNTKVTAVKINNAIEGRVAKANNDGLKKKFKYEGSVLIRTAIMAHMNNNDIDTKFLLDGAIYMIQKVRKMLSLAAGEGNRVDPYTIAILRNAHDLEAKKTPFTSRMQLLALSSEFDADGSPVTQMKHRQGYGRGTAQSQSATTRRALETLGMASIKREGQGRTMSVDFKHPLVRLILGLDADKKTAPKAKTAKA